MPEESTTTPEAAPAAPAKKVYRTIQEEKFFATRDASSLPNTPTEVPAQTASPEPVTPIDTAPAPVPVITDEPKPVAAAVAADTTAEPTLAEDDFSAELPGTVPEDGVLLDTTIRHPDSPLEETAPQWQHDAYNRLQADGNISAEDKKAIAELPPGKWDKARKWQADTKLLGRFRDPNVPIQEVYDIFTKQSKTRVAELETEALNRLLKSGESMVSYSSQHPQEYARLMTALINDHSDFVAKALKSKGFNVVKAEPFDKQKIIAELEQHPMWETFSGTDIADLVQQKIEQLSGMVGTNELTPEELANQLDKPMQPASQANESFQKVQTAVHDAQTNQWTKAIGDGLASAGIKPATAEELRKNPAAAHLKTVLYNVALFGQPGVLSDWDSHSAKWGESQPGFGDTFAELSGYLQEGDLARFADSAPTMNPFYFEFGKRRAQTALIQNLYRAVDKMLAAEPVAAHAPEAPQPTATIDGNGHAAPERKYRTNSERRFFEKLNGVSASR